MKIDADYLRNLLAAMEASPTPTFTVDDLSEFTKNEDNFVFHMRLLVDQRLVARPGKQPVDSDEIFGLYRGMSENAWAAIPMRLTKDGHDFIANLRKPSIWNKVKDKFKEEGLSTIFFLTQELALSEIKSQFGLSS